jgi:hypothetical protein
VTRREELAVQFIGHLQNKRFDEAAAMLSQTADLSVAAVPNPIQGREAIVMAMKMAADSGQGLNMVGFGAPTTDPEGKVVMAGKAPKGPLWIVAAILRKAKKVTVTLRFGEGDIIEAMDIQMT